MRLREADGKATAERRKTQARLRHVLDARAQVRTTIKGDAPRTAWCLSYGAPCAGLMPVYHKRGYRSTVYCMCDAPLTKFIMLYASGARVITLVPRWRTIREAYTV